MHKGYLYQANILVVPFGGTGFPHEKPQYSTGRTSHDLPSEHDSQPLLCC